MYNVARYLPDFFASLQRQTYGFDRIEVILVDDGSTDDTAAVAQAFAADHPNVRVVRKENGGQASARNAGLAHATGNWLTFPDPDDVLSDDYFRIVSENIDGEKPQAMLSARLLLWFDADDSTKTSHALDGRFHCGIVTKSLTEEPSWIQPHVTSGFLQREIVQRIGLRFPEDLRLRFEDGAFVSRYLLAFDDPRVTYLPDAEYFYRQRSDNSSTIQSSSANPAKYTDTIRLGFLPLIDQALASHGAVPRWLQNLFLYDQFWILRASQSPAVRNARFPDEMYAELAETLPDFLQHVDDEAISSFDIMYVAPWMREALLLTKHGEGTGPVYWGESDERRGLRSIIYRFRGDRPHISLRLDDEIAEPHFSAVLGLEYAARPIVFQQTLWVPIGSSVRLSLDGEERQILLRPPMFTSAFAATSSQPRFGRLNRLARRARKALRRRLKRGGLFYVRRDLAVNSKRLAERYAHAWVFIDRDVDAGDSAEDQYWWMREQHPEVNAWFVVRKGTADWKRMSDRGARLVGYGTPEFYALLRHADHLASSHADRFITDVLPRKMRPPRYAFTFLQHGVIKGDISFWLNPKNIQVFIASTEDEYRYLTESTAFRYSAKEVQLTGLPRFDVLKERADAVPAQDRNLILIMPTWRDYLVGRMGTSSADRQSRDNFAHSEYAVQISRLLNDPDLIATAEASGRRIVFMPHPNMRPYLAQFTVPEGVEVRSYEDTDVREMIVRAALLITDYSSVAFNAAYIQTPVLYFQFDREEYFAGHTERAGYFDYERDGFGPVASASDEAVALAVDLMNSGTPEIYLDRMQSTFPVRDGRNRERVFGAMRAAARRPLSDA